MSRLAILIPFMGNAKRLEDTLVSVLENRPDDCEIAVVLARPYDNPYHLDDEVSFLPLPGSAGLAACLNAGLSRVRAPFVHVLACGVEVCAGWADVALAHFQDATVAAVAPLVVALENRDRIVCAGVDYQRHGAVCLLDHGRRKVLVNQPVAVLAPPTLAAFYRRWALDAAGRFSEEVGDHLTMIDMGLTLRHLGLRTLLVPGCAVAAPARAEPSAGAFRRSLEAERFFWRWAGTNGWAGALAPHALHAAVDCLGGVADLSVFARLAGRLVGFCRGGAARQHRDRLQQMAEQSRAPAVPSPKSPAMRVNASAPGSNGKSGAHGTVAGRHRP
ncbi:MAG: glycosyltransferase family 2 protein [Thermoguttaceae bacterium]|nr:glycosyltransferase family 2 protein [Thermoguttaceae bacterium]